MEDKHRYDDIIGLEHPTSARHPRMSAADRAAQFAPFAALTGYGGMVSEASRLTDSRIEPDEMQLMALNAALVEIMDHLGESPRITVTWFREDGRKKGGSYVRTEGQVRNVDISNRLIILRDGTAISMDDILEMKL